MMPRRCIAALLSATGLVCSVTATDARAARYVARPADGGRIVFHVQGGRLVRVAATLPARCENNHGGSWTATLAVDLNGRLALRSGGFSIQGQARNKVRYQLGGRLRGSAISGSARLTYLDLDFVGPSDDSYLCNTGPTRYRGMRRR